MARAWILSILVLSFAALSVLGATRDPCIARVLSEDGLARQYPEADVVFFEVGNEARRPDDSYLFDVDLPSESKERPFALVVNRRTLVPDRMIRDTEPRPSSTDRG